MDSSMIITTRTTTLTETMIIAASTLVRVAHRDELSLIRALAKAEPRLLSQAWNITDGQLHMESHSEKETVQITDGDICTCKTNRGVCYHRACWWLLSCICAAGINPIAPHPLALASVLDNTTGTYDDTGDFLDALPLVAPLVPFVSAFEEVDGLPEPFARRRPAVTIITLQPSRMHVPADAEGERWQRLVDELAA